MGARTFGTIASVLYGLAGAAVAQDSACFIYWGEFEGDGGILRKNLDSGAVETLLADQGRISGIFVDVEGRHVYWTNYSENEVWRSDLNGFHRELLVSVNERPHYVYVDFTGGKIYYATSHTVRRADLDGSNEEMLVSGYNFIIGMTYDPVENTIYWNNNENGPGLDDQVFRKDLDTGVVDTLYTTPGSNTAVGGKMAIDHDASPRQLYLALHSVTDWSVLRSDLDGSSLQSVSENGDYGLGLALDASGAKVYWSSLANNISRADLGTGANAEDPLFTVAGRPESIAFACLGPYSAPLGCGVNPAASFTIVAGEPALGEVFTVGVDNPAGTSPPGSLALVGISLAPDAAYPCGTLVPGLGMSGPSGELLVSIAAPNPIVILGPVAWTGAGVPAPLPTSLPNAIGFVGLNLFLQGVLAEPTGHLKLTDGLEITIGIGS